MQWRGQGVSCALNAIHDIVHTSAASNRGPCKVNVVSDLMVVI